MTLSERNIIFKAGLLFPAIILAFVTIVSFSIMPLYHTVIVNAPHRSSGFVQEFVTHFFNPQSYAPFVSILIAVVYAFVATIVIYYRFKKTQSPEILYIVFFVLSFVFEASRIMLPINLKYDLPNLYLIVSSRFLLFGRYFGIFSLFAASVYATGFEVQKQKITILVIALISLVISLKIPIDGLSWDTSLCMVSGYNAMFNIIEMGIALITLISFFIASYSRGLKAYLFVGFGAFLVMLGRAVLFTADTWITPFPALLILIIGTWFICTKLHSVYLWY